MALKLVNVPHVVFAATEGTWGFITPQPEGWSSWGLGRVYPTPGTYWVQGSGGLTWEHRPDQQGTPLTGGEVITITEGDYVLCFGGAGALMLTRLA